MKSRVRHAVAGLAALWIGLLAGCDGQGPATAPQDAAAPAEDSPAPEAPDPPAPTPPTKPAAAPAATLPEGVAVDPPSYRVEGEVAFEERPPEPGVARIEFKEPSIDLGIVTDTGVYQASFHFINRGAEELVISKVKTGCKCAQASISRLTYGPGEQGSIVVTLKPTGKEGYRPSPVQVLSNSTPNELETISLQANIQPMLVFESKSMDLGRLEIGREHVIPFTMTSGLEDLRFVRLKANRDWLELRAGQRTENPDGTYTIPGELVVPANAPWCVFRGLRAASVNLQVRGTPIGSTRPATGSYSLRIEGSVYSEVVPTVLTGYGKGQEGALLYLGNVRGGAGFEHRLRLEGRSRPFQVTGAAVEGPVDLEAEASFVASGERGWEIVFTGTVPARRGPLSGEILVTTDVAGEEEVRLAFQASVTSAR